MLLILLHVFFVVILYVLPYFAVCAMIPRMCIFTGISPVSPLATNYPMTPQNPGNVSFYLRRNE